MDFVESIAMNTIRNFLNNAIKKFNIADLHGAIRDDRDLWDVTPGTLLSAGKVLKGLFGKYLPRYFDQMTTDLLLNDWLAIDRPEFALKIKTTPGGYQWFDRQVHKIKKQILDM